MNNILNYKHKLESEYDLKVFTNEENIKDTVDIVERIKPIYNFKA